MAIASNKPKAAAPTQGKPTPAVTTTGSANQQVKTPVTKPSQAQAKPAQNVARPRPTAVMAARPDDMPDYIKNSGGRGNEGVEMADMVIPRVELVQALSPCLKPSDPAFIEGAQQGDLFNSVTRILYGPSLSVVPVIFKKEYLIWKDRTKGGGFRGAYPTMADAQARIESEEDAEFLQAVETAQHFVLVIKEDGTTEECVVSMNKTKLKVSKQWNSLIRINGNDRFSREYTLFSVDDSNEKGDFKNWGIMNKGFPEQEHYAKAEALYEAIASGARKVVVDTTDGQTGDEQATEY